MRGMPRLFSQSRRQLTTRGKHLACTPQAAAAASTKDLFSGETSADPIWQALRHDQGTLYLGPELLAATTADTDAAYATQCSATAGCSQVSSFVVQLGPWAVPRTLGTLTSLLTLWANFGHRPATTTEIAATEHPLISLRVLLLPSF